MQILMAAQHIKLDPNWREPKSQKFVVLLPDGEELPPKALMSLAIGLPVYAFSGGADLNNKFKRLGFEVKGK
jgi:hypothetical protein